jgi:hypothetical protein
MERLFGDVVLSDRGARPDVTPRTSELLGGGASVTGGEYYTVDCPFCLDSRKRLWVSCAWGFTAFGSRPLTKLAHCFNENCLADPANERRLWLELRRELGGAYGTELKLNDDCPLVPEDPLSPDEWGAGLPPCVELSSPDCPKAVRGYLRARGFNPAVLGSEWGVKVGMVQPHSPYPSLIIPVVMHGVLTGWQARKVSAKGPGPKYYNPPGFKKSHSLYNLDSARSSRRVILVEGVSDCWACGPSAVALFGKKPSARQEALIFSLFQGREVAWLPDENDPESLETARSLAPVWRVRGLFSRIEVVVLPGDPGSNKRVDIESAIEEAFK